MIERKERKMSKKLLSSVAATALLFGAGTLNEAKAFEHPHFHSESAEIVDVSLHGTARILDVLFGPLRAPIVVEEPPVVIIKKPAPMPKPVIVLEPIPPAIVVEEPVSVIEVKEPEPVVVVKEPEPVVIVKEPEPAPAVVIIEKPAPVVLPPPPQPRQPVIVRPVQPERPRTPVVVRPANPRPGQPVIVRPEQPGRLTSPQPSARPGQPGRPTGSQPPVVGRQGRPMPQQGGRHR